MNIGYRPTLTNSGSELRVEVHLLDFDAELYGTELEIAFVEKLREEQKFPSSGALTDQIARDVAEARLRF